MPRAARSATSRPVTETSRLTLDLDALASGPNSNKAIKTTATPKGTVYYFSLNQKNANLAKPEVREAFKWLVDYDAIGKTIMKNIGVVHQNFLPVGLLGAAKDNPYKLDVAKARALLAKAGLAGLTRNAAYAHRFDRIRLKEKPAPRRVSME